MPCRDLLQTRGPPESPWHERRHNQLESSGGACDGSEDSGGGGRQAKEEFGSGTSERLGDEVGILVRIHIGLESRGTSWVAGVRDED